ncbi:hypothetical protein [[Acholeplasma] multilocale]|uniref:hypothetical protein n=1 Tax=[Acholeplasma] multilocale TaxID=264638 RepID=UPI00047B870F|nr:hypothetical protein [[Acholeplasma] multilocale]
MGEFVSRSQKFADQILSTNNEITELRDRRERNEYLSGVMEILKEIDSKYFTEVYENEKSKVDLGKFYLGTDKSKEIINPEIIKTIKDHLEELEVLTPDIDLSDDDKRIRKNFLNSEQKFFTDIFQEIYDAILNIENTTIEKVKNLEDRNKEKKTIAKSAVTKVEYEHLSNKLKEKSVPEITKRAKTRTMHELVDLTKKKNKYKINIKWFVIIAPVLILIMLAAIIVPIFI